jgi:hypothetical protein
MPTKKKTSDTTPEPLTVVVDPLAKISNRQLDEIRKAGRWKMSDLLDEGEPTFALICGLIWLSVRKERPDLTPLDLYDADDMSSLGIEIDQGEAPHPTNAAG